MFDHTIILWSVSQSVDLITLVCMSIKHVDKTNNRCDVRNRKSVDMTIIIF